MIIVCNMLLPLDATKLLNLKCCAFKCVRTNLQETFSWPLNCDWSVTFHLSLRGKHKAPGHVQPMGFPSAVFYFNSPLPPQHPFNLWEHLLLTRTVYVVYMIWKFLTMYIFNLSVTHPELWHLLIFPIREAINRLCEAVPGGKGAWRKKVNLSMNDFLHACQIKNY